MTRIFLIAAAGAALLASTTLASAQVRDDPPGWAFQWRGIQQERGNHYDQVYGGYGYQGGYGYRGPATIVAPRRYYRGYGYDEPPGSRFQDRGIVEEHGEHPWW